MVMPAVLSRYHPEIEASLRSIIAERRSAMYDMMRYHFGWIDEKGRPASASNGKAIRPTMCLLACEGLGGDYRAAMPAAVALELVHNYSLIHDDIQDDDIERRHQWTVWHLWGKAQAINAGTAMRMLADVSLRRLNVPFDKQVRLQTILDEATIRLIEGQYLDINFESRNDVTPVEYMEMVGCKTAALMACSLEVGAELGTDDECVIEAFRSFGWDLGMAFQIKDDILGIWGRKEETGKPCGNDIKRWKKSFPVVFGLQETLRRGDNRLSAYYGDLRVSDDVQSIVDLLENVGALEEAERVTGGYIESAMRTLDSLRITSAARADFSNMISFLKTRTF